MPRPWEGSVAASINTERPALASVPSLIAVGQTVRAEICRKNWTTTRLSRSLKIIGTDLDQSDTYDFLLVIHSNRGPMSSVSSAASYSNHYCLRA